MQHVVRHWQGSLSEADSSAAMQMDSEAAVPTGQTNLVGDGAGHPQGTPVQAQEPNGAGEPLASFAVSLLCLLALQI